MNKKEMVSLQIPEDVLSKFDEVQRQSGYTSRSEALRSAILLFIKSKQVLKKEKGIKKAVISVFYKVEFDTLENISKIDNRFSEIIKTFSEFAVGKTIRVYIVIGKIDRLNDFFQAFNVIRDIQTNMHFI
jgi:metal-responsive CopG/Arc/MetJ family transcriptional regulator